MSLSDTTTDRIAASVTRPKVVIALLLVALASGAVLASVTLTESQDVDQLNATQATLNESEVLSTKHINVSYTGFTADHVNVTIENTDTVNHVVDIYVEVKDGDTTRNSTQSTDVTINSESTHKVKLMINEQIFDFDIINVLVREVS